MVSSQQNKHFLIAYIVQTGTWGLYVCVWRFNWWSVQHHQPLKSSIKNGHLNLLHTHTHTHSRLLHMQSSFTIKPPQNLCLYPPPTSASNRSSLKSSRLTLDPPLSFPPRPSTASIIISPSALLLAHLPNTNFKFRSCTKRVFPFPSDPAVGAEPGEIQPGSLQDALLPRKSAGRRAAQPEEPARHCQPPHQNHPGTPGDFLSLLLSRTGKEYIKRRF